MFRIRRIHDDVLPVNQQAIREVQDILREHFDALRREDIEQVAEKLRNPFKQKFRSVLYVAEGGRRHVLGFASAMHEPELRFCFLDFIAARKAKTGRGIGAALYEHVRDEALTLGARGLFFECLPDDPTQCADPSSLRENAARLRFYERYGARPVAGTDYQLPIKPDDDCMPFLMFDDLDQGSPLSVSLARRAVRAILERKYAYLCPPSYVEKVVRSFKDEPLALRPPKYIGVDESARRANACTPSPIAMTVNDKHNIHHIREKGYVESPARISVILGPLERSGIVERVAVRQYPLRHVTAVHEKQLIRYLERACRLAPEKKSVYPYVFPIRNAARPPKELSVRAGYYCIDTFTPIHRNAYLAAKRAVDCTLTAANEIVRGGRLAYSLVRPPGHHAERRVFGGFCYMNNAAVAAHYLSVLGKVAILDVDYHHGNGQQDIFYDRADVLTVSIHGDPDFAYPYFSGFADETGVGPGAGHNLNFPLPEVQDGAKYRKVLQRALRAIADARPAFLVVALGLDTAKGDPTGTWSLGAPDFEANGAMIGELGLPTLVVQEGGYRTRTLGTNARHFFSGLLRGAHGR